jgi:SAM-dependent methyltransferase
MTESPIVFDRSLQRRRRLRAARLPPANFLLDHVAGELADRLGMVLRRFDIAVDLGTPGEAVRAALRKLDAVGTIVGADVIARGKPFVIADEETLPFRDASLDLVVSGLALHFVNDVPGVLAQIRRALKPDGLFVAALFGGETLTELRQAFAQAETEIEGGVSPRVAPFADLRQLGALLQRAGFALPVIDVERVTVRYGSAFDLMHDVRRMGATNPLLARRRVPLRRMTLMRMAEIYTRRFGDNDGRIRASFDVVWLSGWVPHSDQQQPLRPGSAKARLAEALGTDEISAGEKAGR